MKLEDVARLANVSKSAASLALNGKPGVSEKKRKQILKIAEENNYIPLRKIRKHILPKIKIRFVACTNTDVIPEDFYHLPFFNELLSFISNEISLKQYHLITNSLPKDDIFDSLNRLESNEPTDGIILLATNLSSIHLSPIIEAYDNLVILDTQSNDLNCNTITMNNFLGAFDVTNYLLNMGHKNIGYIKGTPRINNFYDRRRGFNYALDKRGINAKNLPVYYLPGMKFNVIENKIPQFLDFVKTVSAIFCEDDYIAISVIKTLKEHNISIPEEISIVGFDDISESSVLSPELTTVHVPIVEIAREAIKIIEDNIHLKRKVKKQILLNTNLIIRSSVKNFRK